MALAPVVPLRQRRVMRARSRAHFSYPKSGCRCGRCMRLRRAEHLTAIITLYEERLAEFRRELAEVTK